MYDDNEVIVRAKAWLERLAGGGIYRYEDPQGGQVEEAEEIIQALVAEVERLEGENAQLVMGVNSNCGG